MLSELEEILLYKGWQDNNQFDKMDSMKKTWMKRYRTFRAFAIATQHHSFLVFKDVNQKWKSGSGFFKSEPLS